MLYLSGEMILPQKIMRDEIKSVGSLRRNERPKEKD